MAAVLGCLCAGRILAGEEILPAAGSASHSSTADADLEAPGPGPTAATRKAKIPERPETFETLFKNSNSSGSQRVPPPQQQMDRRTKKMLEDKEDWVFVTPSDVIEDLMTEEKLIQPKYTPDGREKTSLSPMERYLDRINRPRQTASTNESLSLRPFDDRSMEDADTLPGSRGMASRDTSMPGFVGTSVSTRPNGLADLFGLSKTRFYTGETSRESEAEQRRMRDHLESFRKLLETGAPDSTDGFNRPPETKASGWGSTTESYPGAGRSMTPPTPVGFAPSPSPGFVLPSTPTAPYAPGQSPLEGPPPSLTSTRTPPPKVEFSSPRRKF
jgi:hypothetical protein